MVRPINIGGRRYAVKLIWGRAFVPLAHCGKALPGVSVTRIDIKRRIKDQLAADEAAGIVARRIIIVGAKVIGRTIGELACGIYLEDADLSAAPFVTVANHRDRVIGNQHLVIPGIARVNVWPKSISAGDWSQRAISD